jgi:hypothetical protein
LVGLEIAALCPLDRRFCSTPDIVISVGGRVHVLYASASLSTQAPCLCFLLVLLLAAPVSAHPGHRSYCGVRMVPGGLDVTVQVPVSQLEASDDASIIAAAPRYRQELEAHVRATTPAGKCRVLTTGPRLEGAGERLAVFELSFDCPRGPITFGSDYHLDVDAEAEMICAIDGSAHVFRRGTSDRLVGAPPTLGELWRSFIELGAQHVLAGIDHVLFVVSLLLGAASAMAKDAGRTLRRVVGLVTGFTLGHSVTLIVAALGILSLPSRLTESLIALTIVVVAVHNVLDENPQGRGFTSAAFGLIHGFGFAAALAQVGLPARGKVPALLAFNVGIELAQVLIVLLCFPALAWARQKGWFRQRLLIPASCLITGLAMLWLVKRAFGLSILPWLGS